MTAVAPSMFIGTGRSAASTAQGGAQVVTGDHAVPRPRRRPGRAAGRGAGRPGGSGARSRARTATGPARRPAPGRRRSSRPAPACSASTISVSSSTNCSPAPPCTSPSMPTPVAIAVLRPTPQVAAIRAAAMDGACGPWSTDATRAASSSAASAGTAVNPGAAARSPTPGWPTRSAPGPAGRAARSRRARSWTPPSPTTGLPRPPWSRRPPARSATSALCWPRQRRRAGRPQRLAVDEHPVAADPQHPAGTVRVGQVGEETAVLELGQPDRLRHGQDPRGGHPGGGQEPFPLQRRPGRAAPRSAPR